MKRRALVSTLVAAGIARAAHAQALPAERLRWMAQGEAALARGAADAALDAFEHAAYMQHAADAELGIVRSHMQSGQYRRAIAFAAHAAGAHADHPDALALYAWLLHLGGEGVAADRYLRQGLALAPEDPGLKWVRRQTMAAEGPLLAPAPSKPVWLGPVATGDAVPQTARSAGTAILAFDGCHAWMPLMALPSRGRLWLRNGLGQTVAAAVSRRDAARDVVQLVLAGSLPMQVAARPLARPFSGSPVATAEYEVASEAGPAWPLLRLGFVTRLVDSGGSPLIAIQTAAGSGGGPVFDRAGRLVGMAMPAAVGTCRLIPIPDLPNAPLLGGANDTGPEAPNPGPPEADVIYELALRVALQVLVAD